jgi:flagellar hook-associated protein 2
MAIGNIGFSGIGSGLPVDDIIKATLDVKRVPIQRMEAQKAEAKEQISAYSALASRLNSLSSAMNNLRGADKFELLDASSSSEAFSATATHESGATAGNYAVEVVRSAESYRWVSASQADTEAYSGSLDINGQTLNIGDGDGPWTLNQVREAINSDSRFEGVVSANVINEGNGQSRLVFNSQESGEAGRLTIDVTSLERQAQLSHDASHDQTDVNIGGTDYTQVRSGGALAVDPAADTFVGGTVKLSNFSGTGTLNNFDVDLTGKTLNQARDDINATITADAGLNGNLEAFVVTENGKSRLEMRSNNNITNFQLNFEDALSTKRAVTENTNNLSSPATSLDAAIKIDGITATSSTNDFSDVITGVDISISSDAQAGDLGTLKVSRDTGAIKDRVDEFMKAYNDVVIHLNEAKKGPLASEGVVRSVEGILRDVLYTPTGGDGNLDNTLTRLGISTYVESGWEAGDASNSRNGTLEIKERDRDTFNDILENDMETLAFIFGDSETGYARRFEQAAKQLTSDTVQNGQIAKGLIPTRTKGLESEVLRIDDRIEDTNYRLDLLETRLYQQFTSVDSIIANLNSSGDYLASQLDGLPGYTRKK